MVMLKGENAMTWDFLSRQQEAMLGLVVCTGH